MANGQANLRPAKKGEIRNPKGKPKGTIDFTKRVKKMLADPNLAEAILKEKPEWWTVLEEKDPASALIVSMMVRGLKGDVQAFKALVEAGYGNKLDLTSNGETLKTALVEFIGDEKK